MKPNRYKELFSRGVKILPIIQVSFYNKVNAKCNDLFKIIIHPLI